MASRRREFVVARANGCCEYCGLHESCSDVVHEIDHIRSIKHGGSGNRSNLCLACFYCNSFKGSNVAGFDPVTATLQPLFNPRSQTWTHHFEWIGPELIGLTAVGRATIDVLRINLPPRVELRRTLLDSGVVPFMAAR